MCKNLKISREVPSPLTPSLSPRVQGERGLRNASLLIILYLSENYTVAFTRVVFGLVGFTLSLSAAHADDRPETTVGMVAQINQLVLPGAELEVKPLDDRAKPVVLRIVATYPHVTDFRYDLAYYVLEPGTFDLRDFLRRKNGSALGNLPPLPITAKPLLPPGQVQPNRLTLEPTPSLGGYKTLLIVAAFVWVAGLAAIVFLGRRRAKRAQLETDRPLTMADRLAPWIARGQAGKLTPGECADLERTLLAYWRRRLDLLNHRPADVFARLRTHGEAGPLLEQLEVWLHKPGPAPTVDVAALLEPYRALPAQAWELHAEKGITAL